MSDSTAGVESLLGQVRLLSEKYDALAAANGENFNVFKLLGMETDEVRTHSAILADLLDPRGSHGQGVAFARLFSPLSDLSDDELKSARVGAEVAVGGDSRLDILIETNQWCIVIENKIYAADQERQLERYHEFASSRNKKFAVYYLTLGGDPPSKWSLGGLAEERVTPISYREVVHDWLEACIKEVALVPHVREILNQYRVVVAKLTGRGQRNLTMELKELLERKQGDTYNFELAPDIADAYGQVSVDAEWTFWDKLRGRMNGLEGPGWSLALDHPGCLKDVSREVLQTALGSARSRWEYGWTARIESERAHFRSDAREVLFRVTFDGWRLYYAFVVVEGAGADRSLLDRAADETGFCESWSEQLANLGKGWKHGQFWLGWRYAEWGIDMQKSPALKAAVIRKFRDEDNVGPLVDEITTAVDQLVQVAAAMES